MLIGGIRTDGGTQPRSELNEFTVDEYAEALGDGATFPPVVVFYDGEAHWLADGFHRLAAHARAGREEIDADVRAGTRRDAVLFSVGANADHGLPRTNADKRRAVQTLLADEEWAQWSDSEIARRCRVHHTTVGRIRASHVQSTSDRRYVTKHGTTATMKTKAIGSTLRPEERRVIAEAGLASDARTVRKIERLEDDEREAVLEKIEAGEARTVKEAKRRVRDEVDEQTIEETKAALKDVDGVTIYDGDLAEVLASLPASSIDVIITDPPYPEEFLHLWSKLAEGAAHVLKPGGSLVAMSGQAFLPDVIARLGEHLTYHWTGAYMTPGGQATQVWPRKVNTFWKPLLWFTHGKRTGERWVGDVATSPVNDNDKDHHEWGQSVAGMRDVVDRFSEPGAVVLDPFCGAGTTGVACVELGRRFVGVEVNEGHATTARRRIAEAVQCLS